MGGKNIYIVYQHKNKINGKIYIGITMQEPAKRWGANGVNYKSSPHFYSAIQKYGWNAFEHNILFTELSKEEACQKEQELIQFYNSINPQYGYNSTTGGETFKMSEEIRQKKSQAMIGNQNGLGKPCSKEKAEKISKAQKGKKLTEEHKQKLSNGAKNRHTPCSEQKRETLRNNYPKMKQVYCIETDTLYKSVQECARQLGLWATLVSKTCSGKIKSTGGYHLIYYNDTINA